MTGEEIKAALPPILISFGGILPLLVGATPFAIRAECKSLFACVLVLVIWVGYWASYSLGEWAPLDRWPIPTLILLSLALLLSVLNAGQAKPVTVADGKGGMTEIQKIEKNRYFWTYLTGLFLISVAAALYCAPAGRVILRLSFPSSESDAPMRPWSIQGVQAADSAPYIPLRYRETSSGSEVMLTEEEYKNTSNFLVLVKEGNKGKAQYWRASRTSAFALINPGKGKYFDATLKRE